MSARKLAARLSPVKTSSGGVHMKGRSKLPTTLRATHVRWAILESGKGLKPTVRRKILAIGAEAIPALIDVLTDIDILPHVARHAASLLIDFEAPGREALIAAVTTMTQTSAAHDEAVQALMAIGPAIAPQIVEQLAQHTGALPDGAMDALARCGAHSPRIAALMQTYLEQDSTRAAALLADYGDEQFVPQLLALFEATPLSDHELTRGNTSVKEYGEALVALGATLNQEQRLKLQMATAMLKHQQRALTFDVDKS